MEGGGVPQPLYVICACEKHVKMPDRQVDRETDKTHVLIMSHYLLPSYLLSGIYDNLRKKLKQTKISTYFLLFQ